jgi:hypothetical protein
VELEPIRLTLQVPCTPKAAFEGFTRGMGRWWDPAYTPDPDTFTTVTVAPEGLVTLVHGPTEFPVGEVVTWEPGARYRQRFWLAMDPAAPSELDVRFTAGDGGTRVDFEHGGWTEDNAQWRHKFGDWRHLLGRYTALVSQPNPG